jgi:hypothetical protein
MFLNIEEIFSDSRLTTRKQYTAVYGGMGTEMAQTRFPALNIIDAIWVNANPG